MASLPPAMRPFRTGAARIALAYVDGHPDAAPLILVPTGLHFEAKERFRSAAGLVFGEGVDVHAWRRANPQSGAHELTALIEARIRALTANYEAGREIVAFRRGAFSCGLWERDQQDRDFERPYDEVAVILEGEVEVTTLQGRTLLAGPRDVMVTPKGSRGHWKSLRPVRKFWAIYES